jgi:reactive intermediate/imine deaminase
VVALLGQVVFASELCAQDARQYVNPRTPTSEGPPFSDAVLVGNTLYLSGFLGVTAGQAPVSADEEARAVLTNMRTRLEEAGMTMDDLVSVQVYALGTGDYAVFNEVYRTFFTREFPARAFVGVAALVNGARFEVGGIAVRR